MVRTQVVAGRSCVDQRPEGSDGCGETKGCWSGAAHVPTLGVADRTGRGARTPASAEEHRFFPETCRRIGNALRLERECEATYCPAAWCAEGILVVSLIEDVVQAGVEMQGEPV